MSYDIEKERERRVMAAQAETESIVAVIVSRTGGQDHGEIAQFKTTQPDPRVMEAIKAATLPSYSWPVVSDGNKNARIPNTQGGLDNQT